MNPKKLAEIEARAKAATEDSMIEKVAQALAEQEDANDCRRDPGCATLGPYDKFPDHWKEDYRAMARAAIEALNG